MHKLYTWFASSLATAGILGIYIGYSGFVSPSTSVMVLLLSILVGLGIVKNTGSDSKLDKKVLYILIAFAFTLLYVSGTTLVFPHGSGDLQTHSKNVRTVARLDALPFLDGSPNTYYSLAVMLYTLHQNSYQINTLFGMLLLSFSILGVFLTSRGLYGEKIAFFASFAYAFSLTNLWMMEQGFLTQMYGQFFVISSLYFYIKKETVPLVLSNAGLIAYPHYLAIYILFMALETMKTKQPRNFTPLLAASALVAPEVISIFVGRLLVFSRSEYLSENLLFNALFLARGGITTPTLLSLPLFTLGIYGFYAMIKKKEMVTINLSLAALTMISLIIGATAFDYLYLKFVKDVHLLYMAAKMFYIFIFPLSIATGIGIDKLFSKYKAIAIFLLAFHLLYFEGYALAVLPAKASFDAGVYGVFERMHDLEGEFTVGFDTGLIRNKEWRPRFPYRSIVDLPDTGYETGAVAKDEVFRALRFAWAKRTPDDRLLTSKGEEVIRYDDMNVDYFITDKEMDYPVLFKEGKIRVYKILK